jgi:hypothetical protein
VLDMLSLDDIRGDETDELTLWLFEQLNNIFFFGALKKPSIIWTAELDNATLGDCTTGLSDEHKFCSVRCTQRFEIVSRPSTYARASRWPKSALVQLSTSYSMVF